MTFDQIRSIVEAAVLVLATGLGTPAIIQYLLRRKGANKKLALDEEAQDAGTFAVQQKAYADLLDRANAAQTKTEQLLTSAQAQVVSANEATAAAVEELKQYKRDRELQSAQQDAFIMDTTAKLDKLRALFARVLVSAKYTMTEAEQQEFDATKPAKYVRSATRRSR